MTDRTRLAWVRAIHTAIYVVMAVSTLVVLFAGVTGARGPWLAPSLVLILIESVVFAGGGFKCPFTALAARFAGKTGAVSDTFFPERCTRHTFLVFGPLILIGLALLAARRLGWLA
jgi:hypothetical protein